MASHSGAQATSAINEYTPRATEYDASNHGWHADLADDFISIMKPRPGEAVLDLACGTGLVTFRAGANVGPNGIVIGVDITKAMLDIARAKLQLFLSPSTQTQTQTQTNTSTVKLVEADITDPQLSQVPAIQDVLDHRGGFDIISCCSALVLLAHPAAAIKFWASLLRPGGRLIIDVPTERPTIQYCATEILGREIGVEFPFSRAWITGRGSVEEIMRGAGLEVDVLEMTRSYLPERVFERDQAPVVFETEVLGKYGKRQYGDMGEEKLEEVRRAWQGVWERGLGEDGRFRDGHWLYVCLARRRVDVCR